MSKVLGPDFIAIQVRNLTAAKTFYTEVLGLKEAPVGPPHAVVFDTAPIPFAIREPMVDLEAASHLGWGISLWLQCSEADRLHESLVAEGLSIVQEPFDGPFGRTFTFIDPDGYQLTLHEASESAAI